MARVELFTQGWNEEYFIRGMIEFYRRRLSDLTINFYDNGSTDNTVKIAKELGCNVLAVDTQGEIRDDLLTDFKNNIWKNSTADFVIVCDVDEWVGIQDKDLDDTFHKYSCPYFRSVGYNMVNRNMGVRYPLEDKICVFTPDIAGVNYSPGAHTASPNSMGTEQPFHPALYHMKYTMPIDAVIARYKACAERLSDVNKKHGWGMHYAFNEDTIRREYAEHLLKAEEVWIRK